MYDSPDQAACEEQQRDTADDEDREQRSVERVLDCGPLNRDRMRDYRPCERDRRQADRAERSTSGQRARAESCQTHRDERARSCRDEPAIACLDGVRERRRRLDEEAVGGAVGPAARVEVRVSDKGETKRCKSGLEVDDDHQGAC